jgi:hypothetical protein
MEDANFASKAGIDLKTFRIAKARRIRLLSVRACKGVKPESSVLYAHGVHRLPASLCCDELEEWYFKIYLLQEAKIFRKRETLT